MKETEAVLYALADAEHWRDHYRQHIEWTVETLERGQADELPVCLARLKQALEAEAAA